MKKAIIIGASSGIGKALATRLVKNDFIVGVTGRRMAELENLKQSHPGRFVVSCFDCTAENNRDRLAGLTESLGGLDLIIVCAGRGDLNKELNFETEDSTNQLNVIAFTEIVGWSFNYFESQGHGHLAAITSIAGIRGSRIAPAYNASKAYQINYLEGLRQKAKKSGKPIYVTDVRPGFVDTDMAKGEGLFWVATKETAAKYILRHIRKKKDVGYVTKRWWIISKILKNLPDEIYKRM